MLFRSRAVKRPAGLAVWTKRKCRVLLLGDGPTHLRLSQLPRVLRHTGGVVWPQDTRQGRQKGCRVFTWETINPLVAFPLTPLVQQRAVLYGHKTPDEHLVVRQTSALLSQHPRGKRDHQAGGGIVDGCGMGVAVSPPFGKEVFKGWVRDFRHCWYASVVARAV